MLTDFNRRLLTAAIDGELTPAEDAAFRRLMTESAPARVYYQQLVTHSYRLKGMPRVSAPSGLHRAVLARVASAAPASAARPSRVALWLPVAVAASAMLVVSTGALWIVGHIANAPEVARRTPRPSTPGPVVPDSPPTPDAEKSGTPDAAPAPLTPHRAPEELASREPREPRPPAPEVPAGPPDLIGAALLNAPPPLERVEIRLPFLAAATDLDRPDVLARLADEFGHDAAYRLDLFTPDAHRGADAFLAAAKQVGLTVAVDAVAHERMKRKLPTAWAVYTDALTPDDIGTLAAALAPHGRAPDKPAFGAVHLFPARDAERRELRELLGTEPASFKRAKPAPQPGKPIAAGTADQIAAALAKSKTGDNKPGVLLTLLPAAGRANPQASREVREFLSRRDDRKPGAVALLVVIRPTGS